jgi:hypothetical protein
VWAFYLVTNIVLAYASREFVRETLERRWKAGIGLKRVLIAGWAIWKAGGGQGPRASGTRIQGRRFLDDRAAGDHIGYRGLPSDIAFTDEIIRQETIDHVYVALPLE